MSPEDKNYTIYSSKDQETGLISDIHLSEQYTNGSFIVDVTDFGEVEGLDLK